jgi:lipopolysaccharide/colanic/teichoic acid biosynthesis glycosyltransferase
MYRRYGKRWLDLLTSSMALVLLSPIMLLVALAIRIEDGGPALFQQERVGREGRPFTVLKFRSMPVDTGDKPSAEAKTVSITRVGTIIRRTNLDELPQLINIWRGDMSVVGPRPALAAQVDLCRLRKESGALACKPGLTGLAQINAYDGMPDSEKAAWDAQYCRQLSFCSDVRIILGTFIYLLKPPPVY